MKPDNANKLLRIKEIRLRRVERELAVSIRRLRIEERKKRATDAAKRSIERQREHHHAKVYEDLLSKSQSLPSFERLDMAFLHHDMRLDEATDSAQRSEAALAKQQSLTNAKRSLVNKSRAACEVWREIEDRLKAEFRQYEEMAQDRDDELLAETKSVRVQ